LQSAGQKEASEASQRVVIAFFFSALNYRKGFSSENLDMRVAAK
jgi:hypothetical protein